MFALEAKLRSVISVGTRLAALLFAVLLGACANLPSRDALLQRKLQEITGEKWGIYSLAE